jgi:malonyl-CoA/methylmalonyl-CoA synthetase
LATGADLSEDSIKNNLKQKIAAYKRPKNIFFVDELPRNTMGKVLKNILRDRHKDNFTTT